MKGMKSKKDYDHLLEALETEARIHAVYSNLKGVQKQIADTRLKYTTDFKATFSEYEIKAIDELIKPQVDIKKIEEIIANQIKSRIKKRKAIEQMNRIIEKEDKERKFKADKAESDFIAWFLTAMIKKKLFFYDDLDAVILYEVLKSFLAPEQPNTSLNI